MPKKAYFSGRSKQPQKTTRYNKISRLAPGTTQIYVAPPPGIVRGIRKARIQALKNEESTEDQSINVGDVNICVSNRVDKTDKSKKYRRFTFKSANKPTVTIVDNDPDTPGITGTIKVSGVTYSINLTFDQINEAYGEVITRVTPERVENELVMAK